MWSASFVSFTGDWFQIASRSFLVYRLTGSAAALGIIYFWSFSPMLVVSQVGGVLADRFDRRRLLLATQAGMTVGALLFGLLAQSGRATFVNLCALSLVYGCVSALGQPVQSAVIPSLVARPIMSSAVSLQAASSQLSRVIGPLIAGILLPILGVHWLFYLNAASFLFVLSAWRATPLPTRLPSVPQRSFGALLESWRYARLAPAIRVPLAVTGITAGLGLSYTSQVVAFPPTFLDSGTDELARTFGILQGLFGAGAVVGVVTLAALARRASTVTVLGGVFSYAAVLMALAVANGPIVFVLCFLIAAFQYGSSTRALVLVQHHAPEHLRGRLVALQTLVMSAFPVTGFVFGLAASRFGLRQAIAGLGLLSILAWPALVRGRRHLSEG